MRILYVAPNIPVPGTHGGSTHVTEVVRALRSEHEVLLFSRFGSSGPGVVGLGGPTLPGPLRYALPLAHFPLAYAKARRFRPDAIYERFSAFGLGVLLGKALDVPVISMVLDDSATRITLRGADRLVTTAPHLVPQRYAGKVVEVSWGANIEFFHPEVDGRSVRQRYGLGDEELVVGYTGAFYHWHGLETLIDAAGLVAEAPEGARIRYLLVGDGEMRGELEARIAASAARDRFLLPGKVPYGQVPAHIAAADFCVAPYDPSRHKDLRRHGMFFDPLKVFEYLAVGKASITVNSANLQRLFHDEEHALLVPPAKPRALADAILRLARDAELRQRLGAAGRRIVEERYSWAAHGRQLSELFAELVAERQNS